MGLPESDRLLSAFSAAMVTLHERSALREPPAKEEPQEMSVEEAARELARLSGHVRYSDDDWDQLIAFPHNVEHAYTSAIGQRWSPAEMMVAQRARSILIRHHRTLTSKVPTP